jgi:hypothetical protein
VRRSSAEMRRAIQFEEREAAECRQSGAVTISGQSLHEAVADALRWAAGEANTQYQWIMRERFRENLGKMPARAQI